MKPVLVTGIGALAATGMNTEAYWQSTLEGRNGIGPIRRFDPTSYPVKLAAEMMDFDPKQHVPSRLLVETSMMSHLALAAADAAISDAKLVPAELPEYEMAVITANATGGVEVGQRELQKLWTDGPEHVSAYMSIAWFYAATTGQLSIRHKMRGHCGVLVSEQAGGLDAIGHARRLLNQNHRMALAGGTESTMAPSGLAAQIPTGWLSAAHDPARAYLPFDRAACGYLPGEGGAILVLETADSVTTRGVSRIYGEIAGYAATMDPRPGTGRPPTLGRAAELAMRDAGVGPADIDVVFADAAGVAELDQAEAAALAAIFGPRGVPVTAPKTGIGRLYGGGGSMDVATALLAIRDRVIPPTINVSDVPAEYQVDLVLDQPRPARLRHALVLGRGYGGFNAAVVVRGPQS